MTKGRRSLPYLVEPSATAPGGVRAGFRDEHVCDSRAEINVRRWDELSDEDMSNWRSLWQRARERPELSPDYFHAHVSAGFVREPRLVWLADKGGWRGAVALGAHPKLPRAVSERHLSTPWGGEVIGLAPVVEPGFEPQFAAFFLTWLHSQRLRLLATDLRGLSNRSAMTDAFLAQAADSFDVSITTELNVPYRQQHGLWTPELHASGKLRQQLRRRARQLDGRSWGLVCADRAIDPDRFYRAFDRFVEIEGSGWKRGIGALAQDAVRLRYFQLLLRDARDIGARMYSLSIDRAVAASMVVIYAHERFLVCRIAYDETYVQYSPGVLLMAATLEAISRECPTAFIDTGGEVTPFIRRWFDRRDERVRISLYARTPAGRAYCCLRERLSRVRRRLRCRRSGSSRGADMAGNEGSAAYLHGLLSWRWKGCG
jgi:CelD/BcsL family acetyltransferase involved in cellulose biosynthesis